MIVVGGNTFGAAIAEHIWFRQKQRRRASDAGNGSRPVYGPEHVQNTGIQGFADPSAPFFLNENGRRSPRATRCGGALEVGDPFKGLAYAVGGRSLYWGGWSPRLLDEEMA